MYEIILVAATVAGVFIAAYAVWNNRKSAKAKEDTDREMANHLKELIKIYTTDLERVKATVDKLVNQLDGVSSELIEKTIEDSRATRQTAAFLTLVDLWVQSSKK